MPAGPNLHGRAVGASDFGSLVRARRRVLGLRQSDLADLAGVSERFVHEVEAGKMTVRLDKLVDVLDAVGLHLQVLRGSAPWLVSERADSAAPA